MARTRKARVRKLRDESNLDRRDALEELRALVKARAHESRRIAAIYELVGRSLQADLEALRLEEQLAIEPDELVAA